MPEEGEPEFYWLKKDGSKGKFITTMNNGWKMLEFPNGQRKRFPLPLLTREPPAGAKEEEPAKKDDKKSGGGGGGKEKKEKKEKPKKKKKEESESEESDDDKSEESEDERQLERQDSVPNYAPHEYRLPAPSASTSKVGKWLKKMGFKNHVKDAKKNRIDGWALRYMQDVARRASPQEYSQYARQHFPKMTIGEISSLGGRLLYKAGVTEWV